MEKFYETLEVADREKLFAAMREIDAKAQSYFAQVQSRPGNYVEVGGGMFEYRLKGEVLSSYLRALRAGHRPIEALHLAEIERTKIVQNWNQRRGKDYVTHRSEQAEQSLLEDMHRRVVNSIK